MKLALMQPYLLPYIGYFQLIKEVDLFVLYENVTFRKRSYINRNFILNKGSGERIPITLPVKSKSHLGLIGETQISDLDSWRKSFLNFLKYNYKSATHYDAIYAFFDQVTAKEHKSIHAFNADLITNIAKRLGIKTELRSKNEDCFDLESKLEERAEKFGLERKTMRVIDLCKKFGAACYINPIGGSLLYDKEEFLKHEIELKFIQCEPQPYKQFGDSFNRDLSIVDALMHCGYSGVAERLDQFTLV